MAYDWAGNVRELENEIERISALAGSEDAIGVEMLSEEIRGARPGAGAAAGPAGPIEDWDINRSVDALKRHMIVEAVRDTGSKTRAAQRLGIPRQSLQKMMKRLDISAEDVRRA